MAKFIDTHVHLDQVESITEGKTWLSRVEGFIVESKS